VDVELGDDYAKLAALSSEEEKGESLFASMKKRIPWLVALLFMGLAVSGAVGLFEGVVTLFPAIVCFQSLILGMAGNIGTQSLAVTVRALGSEEKEVGIGAQLRIVGRETVLGFLNGMAIGSFSLLTVTGYLCVFSGYSFLEALPTAVCVGLALCFSMSLAGFTGAGIPNILYRLKIDPAIASGPLITTLNDLAAVVSYYGLAWVLLLNFGIKG
jgi:magnesium transporter